MAANEYHFITQWKLEGTVEEVSNILEDTPSLVRWWPSVYLEAQVLDPGDKTGKGRVVRVRTKGWLPYTLRWQFRLIESRRPHGFSLEATGDFVGRGIWSFEQDGPRVRAAYDWQIRAEKPLLRIVSFLLKPLFSANHRWAMTQGEKSLRLEMVVVGPGQPKSSLESLARQAQAGSPFESSFWSVLASWRQESSSSGC